MTDRLGCPECGGTGEHRIGRLVMQCEFCRGAGYVGDDNEPAEERPAPPDVPVWEEPGADLRGCPRCLGTGEVVHLGGIGEPTGQLVVAPCPACSAPDR